jgi:hypothetical protein
VTVSTATLTPGPKGPGAGAVAETHLRTGVERFALDHALLERAGSSEYHSWLGQLGSAAACTRPVRLQATHTHVDSGTGEILGSEHARLGVDGVVYKGCGNRRASVCEACAEVYRRDAYQLVISGLRGGKGVPESVAGHPAVFVTLTAPSFGPVHTRRLDRRTGKVRPCRAWGKPCPHHTDTRCTAVHAEDDKHLGQPLCRDCYDYPAHAVWNAFASELWRRTTIAARRALGKHARAHRELVKLSFGKVAEYQRRGVVHFHALVRLDGIDPIDPAAVVAPPAWASVFVLASIIREAVEGTGYTSPDHPAQPGGWPIRWGEQLDIRPVSLHAHGEITDGAVAAYLAKYATKSTETTGHASQRITTDTVSIYADPRTHTGRLISACWTLGRHTDYRRLRRWAHMLGFGGHFFTKSRAYSTTFRALRQARVTWTREHHRTAEHLDDTQTTLVVTSFSFSGIGWKTTADALLANTAAAMARERAQAARDEYADSLSSAS